MKAFPNSKYNISDTNGMELRDYFAAKFIPEICKHSEFKGWNHKENAEICYAMADAMMEARKEKK
jgi:hypothetical protein